ncbi:hypothetical protein [Aestuariivirga sp.]|uniref:hypothetical protein n=1 Tax=Aestuariivirga sp. TaxID=2650926 RepID=UPI0039E35747
MINFARGDIGETLTLAEHSGNTGCRFVEEHTMKLALSTTFMTIILLTGSACSGDGA